jgi:hypothetical protein
MLRQHRRFPVRSGDDNYGTMMHDGNGLPATTKRLVLGMLDRLIHPPE